MSIKVDTRGERLLFQRVFLTQDGREVLAWLANECGEWSQNPEIGKPELRALYNRILGKLGIVTPVNLFALANALADTATMADLELMPDEGPET